MMSSTRRIVKPVESAKPSSTRRSCGRPMTQAKRRAVGLLAQTLRPGGVLLVGRTESLFNVPEAPPLISRGSVLAHRKPEEAVRTGPSRPANP